MVTQTSRALGAIAQPPARGGGVTQPVGDGEGLPSHGPGGHGVVKGVGEQRQPGQALSAERAVRLRQRQQRLQVSPHVTERATGQPVVCQRGTDLVARHGVTCLPAGEIHGAPDVAALAVDCPQSFQLLFVEGERAAGPLADPVPVSRLHQDLLTQPAELLAAVVPQGLQHGVARWPDRLIELEDRALDEGGHVPGKVVIWLEPGADGLSGLLVKAAGKDREPGPQSPLALLE